MSLCYHLEAFKYYLQHSFWHLVLILFESFDKNVNFFVMYCGIGTFSLVHLWNLSLLPSIPRLQLLTSLMYIVFQNILSVVFFRDCDSSVMTEKEGRDKGPRLDSNQKTVCCSWLWQVWKKQLTCFYHTCSVHVALLCDITIHSLSSLYPVVIINSGCLNMTAQSLCFLFT